jgi:hypothetical protein
MARNGVSFPENKKPSWRQSSVSAKVLFHCTLGWRCGSVDIKFNFADKVCKIMQNLFILTKVNPKSDSSMQEI